MMDISIDTLIYIVIGVIFVLAQVARKRKAGKPAEAAPVQPPPVESDEDPGDFWKKFLGVEELSERIPEPVTQVPADPPIDLKPFSSRRNEPSPRGRRIAIPVPPILDDDVRTDDAGLGIQVTTEKVEPGFDLRSAVIHSVILERKYL
ncbi:MAG: VOC family protein [Bacteroidales bacterium]